MTVNALFVPQPNPHYCTLQHKMCITRQVLTPWYRKVAIFIFESTDGMTSWLTLYFPFPYSYSVFLNVKVIGIIQRTNNKGDKLSPWKMPLFILTFPSNCSGKFNYYNVVFLLSVIMISFITIIIMLLLLYLPMMMVSI